MAAQNLREDVTAVKGYTDSLLKYDDGTLATHELRSLLKSFSGDSGLQSLSCISLAKTIDESPPILLQIVLIPPNISIGIYLIIIISLLLLDQLDELSQALSNLQTQQSSFKKCNECLT